VKRVDHAEVAAPAAKGPEQVRVALGVRHHHGAVGGHDLGLDEVVTGQPRDRHEPAEAAAERQPADPRVTERSARHGQPVGEGGGVDVIPLGAAACMREAALNVDLDTPHRRERYHERIVGQAVARHAVATATDRDRKTSTACRLDGGHDLGGRRTWHDRRGATIKHPVERDPVFVVRRVIGQDRA